MNSSSPILCQGKRQTLRDVVAGTALDKFEDRVTDEPRKYVDNKYPSVGRRRGKMSGCIVGKYHIGVNAIYTIRGLYSTGTVSRERIME